MSVGIVVPTLGEADRRNYLREAISSINAQREVDVLLVVVTVASRVAELQAMLPSARVLSQPGRGIVDAIEHGWSQLPADVEFVAWLGDDDRLAGGALGAAVEALEAAPGAGMVFGRCRYIGPDGGMRREVRPGRIAVSLLRMGTNLIAQPGALYRRAAVENLGGLDRGIALAFDVDLHLRLSRSFRAIYLPRVLGEARAHPGSLTTSQRARSLAEADWVTSRDLQQPAATAIALCRPVTRFAARVSSKISSRSAA